MPCSAIKIETKIIFSSSTEWSSSTLIAIIAAAPVAKVASISNTIIIFPMTAFLNTSHSAGSKHSPALMIDTPHTLSFACLIPSYF
ncbi:hypothetical protein BpHYR1_010108 [Brachionus plicatilis]|uniref:Uncharacterized protein n=1 Tax=Brachionus plicatilis TaxID=10195 RepID=A0A3M7S733_BRAPC|nr:hypothetical protein BpHYR1_010108 [Brachionus plicatilis]